MDRLFFVLLLVPFAAACGSEQLTGCDDDTQCRDGRVCHLETNTCGQPYIVEGDEPIRLSEVPDPPAEVTGDLRARASDFVGTWSMQADGRIQISGSTTYQYDENWTMVVEPGDSHDLTVTFTSSTLSSLDASCSLDAQLSGGGFLLRGGPCRAEGAEFERFSGSAYIDDFDMLSVDILGNGWILATGAAVTARHTLYGEVLSETPPEHSND